MVPEGSLPCQQEPTLTNSMGRSPISETNSRLAAQEIPRLVWNPLSYSLEPTLSQINLKHALKSYSFNIHFNIILPSKIGVC
jgi:hypothetical protein